MTNDEVLTLACKAAKERLDSDYLEKLDKINEPEISAKVRNKLIKYISDLQNNSIKETYSATKSLNKKTLKAVLIAAILILLMAVGSFAISPVRNYIIEMYEDSSEFIFNSFGGNDYLFSICTYIPDGYVMESEEKLNSGQLTVYKSGDKRIVIDSGKEKNSVLYIDTEASKTTEIMVQNSIGYLSETKTSYILVWSTGKCYYSIVADYSENITVEDVIKIAENMVPEK